MHDVLLGWNMELAQKQDIVKVAFDTYGAFALTLLRFAWLSYSHNAVKEEDDSVVLSLGLPTPLRLHKHEIHSVMFQALPMKRIGRIHSTIQGWGMLVNTFEGLEPEYLQHLRNLTGKKVWSTGPVLLSAFFEGAVRVSTQGKMADISEDKLLQWLDSQSSCSVAYILFGSQTFLTEEQSKALAGGLEASEQPFIWAIKVSPEVKHTQSDLAHTYLPEGFQERTKNRGLLIWGWVPQLVILSHPSIGAFISHCGWNSMLESVTLGVPLITWPMIVDQHFNSKLAVESGIGIQVCEHIDGIPDKERVKEGVTLVLSKDKGKQMKRQAEKLKDMARKAVACGGSSNANLQDFVTAIQKLQKARTAAREQSSKAPKDHCVPKFI
ncbi:anthocyanidin 3-O-glucosyltransferase 4 [Cryptomeria japonica]|uniref:anthocyanidin 3-O-glucosyltransferase 4 n=1 Tax=Cryptomeria japonica TaxID=3369 RepID=UPI0027DA0A2E|nr:anthocyanidin 3-O-glucosyltransferase 4 [Cryptomeria japonica]